MTYYKFFDDQSNQGRVFDCDLTFLQDVPTHPLTPMEIAERENWRIRMPHIYAHYEAIDPPQVTTTEILLQQRVMVPNLASTSVSSRSNLKKIHKGRRYPETINAWTGFDELVDAFQPPHKTLRPRQSDIFNFSSSLTNEKMSLSDENEEKNYMLMVLKKSLMMTDLMGTITNRGGMGKPDAIALKTNADIHLPLPDDIGLIVEFRSTRNLLMPMDADAVAAAYNEAYRAVSTARDGRSPMWALVCHPIGQLLGYMVENGKRYGVLSSATRSYFMNIEGNASNAQVRISNSFFVGQPNFLRAWAFVHSLARRQSERLVPNQLTWKLISKDQPTPPAESKYRGSLRSTGDRTGQDADANEVESTDMPHAKSSSDDRVAGLTEISIDEVEILGTLGYGHNGVVHLAKWGDRNVALKQFDVGKDGYEAFDNEVAAYVALQDAWGILVPKPLFVSESWSGWIKFIGLQLGRTPKPGEDVSDWNRVLSCLALQYGFRHNDADGGNMVFVTDETTGTERLVAIDLEAHTLTTA